MQTVSRKQRKPIQLAQASVSWITPPLGVFLCRTTFLTRCGGCRTRPDVQQMLWDYKTGFIDITFSCTWRIFYLNMEMVREIKLSLERFALSCACSCMRQRKTQVLSKWEGGFRVLMTEFEKKCLWSLWDIRLLLAWEI